jgi:hypothetical protein
LCWLACGLEQFLTARSNLGAQVGYGDVLPVNHTERVYSVFVALIGVVIFAFAMGNITTLMATTQGARLRFDDKLRMVSEYLLFRDTEAVLKRKIQAHYGGCWRRSGDLHEEMPLLESLPRHLRRLAYEQLAPKAEVDVPMLKGLEADVVGRVYVLLELVQFMPSDTVYKTREMGGEMYFVIQGTVDLKGAKGMAAEAEATTKSIYRPGDFTKLRSAERGGSEPYFGELSLFPEICAVRTEDATARTNVEALVISLDKLERLRESGAGGQHFYLRLFDFCRLQASRFGISNQALQGHVQHAARGFPRIDQMCTEVRRDLMARHVQILKDAAEPSANGDTDGASPLAVRGSNGPKSPTSPKTPVTGGVAPVLCEGATLVSTSGKLLHALPSSDKAAASHQHWRKCVLAISPATGEVKYMVDEIGHLTRSRPPRMGFFVIEGEEGRESSELLALSRSSALQACSHAVIFKVSEQQGGQGQHQRVVLGMHSKREAVQLRSSILQFAASFSQKQAAAALLGAGGPASAEVPAVVAHAAKGRGREATAHAGSLLAKCRVFARCGQI